MFCDVKQYYEFDAYAVTAYYFLETYRPKVLRQLTKEYRRGMQLKLALINTCYHQFIKNFPRPLKESDVKEPLH